MFYKNQHELFMLEALKQARNAWEKDEVPVGAVIVHKNKVIAKAYNQVEMLKDATAHAEILAITQAASFLGNKWLFDCAIYVTIEPCSMCAGALVLARVKEVFFGALDPKTGACGSIINIADNKNFNHRVKIKGGILKEECSLLLTEFFRKQRALGKK